MVEAIRKRPFLRPLLIWIVGILLQVAWDLHAYAYLLILFPLFLFGLSLKSRTIHPEYLTRWVWGVVFCSLWLFLSIQLTALSQHQLYDDQITTSQLIQKGEQWRSRLLEPVENLAVGDEEKAIFSTITLGDRSEMPITVRKQFAVAGVAHILAVSGFHVAIVCSFVTGMLGLLVGNLWGGKLRFVGTLLLLWVFTWLTGAAASAVRAALMLTLYLIGRNLDWEVDRYNVWAAAACLMLLYDPLMFFDIGFQLSYLAVLSIFIFQPRLQKLITLKNPLLRSVWGILTLTLAAQIGTLPLCLFYFGQCSTVFLFSNLPLTIGAGLLIPFGLLWLFYPAGLWGSGLLQKFVETLLHDSYVLVEKMSKLPGAGLDFRFEGWMAVSVYLLLVVIIYKNYATFAGGLKNRSSLV